ncbi:MAG TPA: flagellar basal body L-ring protein FlgH [Opitutaceae bacterium]|jgi:flagellar L-ring protein precursor FlgH|nr:flagellar basal body L-ring protein FlgH [Opitutaceae bacterium]
MSLPRLSLLAPLPLLLALGAVAARADSLWNTSGNDPRSLLADHKACHSGDIVTVVVQESAAASTSQSKESTRTTSVNDAVSQFLFPSALTHNGATPSVQLAGKTDYTGGGQVSNSQSVTSRAAVMVTDALPNGNLVIEGVRLVTFSGETQYVVLHGVIRGDDIGSDNTILSSNIAEARVEFVSTGALSDAQKLGWFSKLYEKLRPF